MANAEAAEKAARGWISTALVPVLLAIIIALVGVVWGDIKSVRIENLEGLASQRADDRADVAALAVDVRFLSELTRINQTIMTQLQVLIGVLADDTADLEAQVRALQNWQRAVLGAQ